MLKGQPLLKNLLKVLSSYFCLYLIGQNCVTGHPKHKGGWHVYTLGLGQLSSPHHQNSVSKEVDSGWSGGSE